MYDPALVALSTEEKVEMALAIERAALGYDPRVVLTNRCSLRTQVATVAIANSKGVAGSYDKTLIAGFLAAMAVDEQDRSMAFGFGVQARLADFDPEGIGQQAARKAVDLLGGRPVPTQKATVVYSPFAAASIAGALSRALSAEAMQRNRSFLQGKMGEVVASDVVTVLDNGRLPGGIATRPFDDEGLPTSATRLIDEGVLQAVLYDHYTALRDGTASSTGNATRTSHSALPQVMASNFYFQPGPQSPEEVIAGVEQGLYVEHVMNTASINPISGDYSVSAKGYWIENGKLAYPVNEVTVALPLQELLMNVQAVANDLTFLPMFGALGSPTLRVDGVMIGGSG
ncbi:MAG: TldD/PmbA family protein, partial [Caldilineae bacterium]